MPHPCCARAPWIPLVFGACIAAIGAAGCGATTAARAPAIDRAELVKSATFDHDCPADRIHVLDAEDEAAGTSRYLVEVCGTRHVYQRVGSMYFDAKRRGDGRSGG